MPVQWTAHIPQAMQRHGGSIKPQAAAQADEKMSEFLKIMRRDLPSHLEDQITER